MQNSANTESERRDVKDYISAPEAMKLLSIRQQSLYAYVSRGWIRSVPQPGKKDKLYLREDVDKLVTRSRARSGHGAVAASAMNWGEPIIPTSITEITPEGPRYRGRLAVDLARMRMPFESVAELLWTGIVHDELPPWPRTKASAELKRLTDSLVPIKASDQLLEIFAMVTLHLGISRGTVADRIRNGRTLDASRQIIQTLVGCCGFATDGGRYVPMLEGQTIAKGLMQSLSIEPTDENHEAVETLLTLLADHELSPGTFTARVAASSGCTLHSCIASALSVSSGLEIGRLYNRVDEFLKGGRSRSDLMQRAVELQERGVVVPGFVHPLYPNGDPRGKLLLEVARQRSDHSRKLSSIFGFLADMEEKFGLLPRHEFAVVVLTRAMGLSRHAPGALFVLARTAGWMAHVQEQHLSNTLLRPRARFFARP